ncbi:hypothetical protein [Streptomyces sp. NPDC001034]|uniref:hypothetical protein n=1 Tax=Streptomyces sp. NPDC001034 TaxID=3154375 RepID=UPI00332B8F95
MGTTGTGITADLVRDLPRAQHPDLAERPAARPRRLAARPRHAPGLYPSNR